MLPPPVLAFGLGPTEMVVIVIAIVLLFGATKIPALARSLGRAKGEFEKARRESTIGDESKPKRDP